MSDAAWRAPRTAFSSAFASRMSAPAVIRVEDDVLKVDGKLDFSKY
ncbi:hypothetical protein [Bradyrhizobium sp. ARR65]|nr:hypothetical protein [Bradyrhizobium sp. ARR65]